ncbi:efflux RND transporter periplasmic adaptor subunit [Aurantivibrio infirmus]
MKKVLLPVGILGVATLLCVILVLTKPSIDEKPAEQALPTIRTTTVENQTVTLNVSSRGKVQPAIVSELSAFVGGPVVWISPALVAGGYFNKGEVALRIEPSDFQTALERSNASKLQAEAEAKHATTELRRVSDLADRGLTSDSNLQDAKRLADVANARLLDAEAGFNQAKLNLSRTEIKVPFNSIVSARKIELGQFVSTGQSVAEVYGADVVEVKLPLANRQLGFLDLPEKFSSKESEAPKVLLKGNYAGSEHVWHGTLVRTEAGIDASNNTVQAIVQVHKNAALGNSSSEMNLVSENTQQELSPLEAPINTEISEDLAHVLVDDETEISLPFGLFVQAEITGRTIENVISLPRHVIRNNDQVLVVSNDNTLHFREVEILRMDNERVLIQGGLRSGERVCLSPIQAVVDGMKVNPVNQ